MLICVHDIHANSIPTEYVYGSFFFNPLYISIVEHKIFSLILVRYFDNTLERLTECLKTIAVFLLNASITSMLAITHHPSFAQWAVFSAEHGK